METKQKPYFVSIYPHVDYKPQDKIAELRFIDMGKNCEREMDQQTRREREKKSGPLLIFFRPLFFVPFLFLRVGPFSSCRLLISWSLLVVFSGSSLSLTSPSHRLSPFASEKSRKRRARIMRGTVNSDPEGKNHK